MSLFISFEGGEGSGKTTQTEVLRRRLQSLGFTVVSIREPGSTPLGDYVRAWLIREQRDKLTSRSEVFLFAAARAELVAKTIAPALKRPNTVVIADRYADSTTAYQGYGRRLPLRDIGVINQMATQGLMPSVTFVLNCPPEEALSRVGSHRDLEQEDATGQTAVSRLDREGTRRFEQESLAFHRRVRDGYIKIAKGDPQRVQVIDGTQDVDSISEQTWSVVRETLDRAGTRVDAESGMKMPLWADGPESESDQEAD